MKLTRAETAIIIMAHRDHFWLSEACPQKVPVSPAVEMIDNIIEFTRYGDIEIGKAIIAKIGEMSADECRLLQDEIQGFWDMYPPKQIRSVTSRR